MISGAALTGALLITLATPATWPLALATFFVRGGLLLVVFPIVVLPSPVGLGNLLAPTLMSAVFGGVSVEVALIVGTIALALVAWILIGGLMAASLEAEAARIAAHHEDVVAHHEDVVAHHEGVAAQRTSDRPARPVASRPPGEAPRILAARLLAHVPTGLAVTWGSARLVAVAYRELTSPLDVATPIGLRVLLGAPEVIAVIVVTWMFGEILGGIAARRIALGGAGIARALRSAVVTLVRHPLAVLIGFWVPTAGLALVVVPSVVAAAAATGTVRVAMRSPGDPVGATLTVLGFVALWIVGLALIAIAVAWRGAVWSVAHQATREQPSRVRGIEAA